MSPIASLLLIFALLQATAVSSARKPVLWHDPGRVEQLDLVAGPAGRKGAPVPPFTFKEELTSGTQPKVKVRDARSRTWAVKWGRETKPEFLAGRIVWACGYFTPVDYIVRRGRITGTPGTLARARKYISADGQFADALFQLWDDGYLPDQSWSWDENPFTGTRELQGLKILVMLASNWDNKDSRDARQGSNTAISERSLKGRPVLAYLVSDWGSSFGEWGAPFLYRDTWNCTAYTAQTSRLVLGVRGGKVDWGFKGSRSVGEGVSVDDVAWLLRYLGRISDRQIGQVLKASGATAEESKCIHAALRARIARLQGL